MKFLVKAINKTALSTLLKLKKTRTVLPNYNTEKLFQQKWCVPPNASVTMREETKQQY